MGQRLSACLISASLIEEKSVSAVPEDVWGRDYKRLVYVWLGRAMPVIPNVKDRGK